MRLKAVNKAQVLCSYTRNANYHFVGINQRNTRYTATHNLCCNATMLRLTANLSMLKIDFKISALQDSKVLGFFWAMLI